MGCHMLEVLCVLPHCSKTLHPSNLITVDSCRGRQPISATWRRRGSSSTARRKLMVGTHPHTQREHTHSTQKGPDNSWDLVPTTARCHLCPSVKFMINPFCIKSMSFYVWVFSPALLLLVWNSVYFEHTIQVSCVYENTKNTETHMWTGAQFPGICLRGCWTVCVCCQMSSA